MAVSPTPGLSSELSSLLSRVAAFDAVAAERDDLQRQLVATQEALRVSETQASGWGELYESRAALADEVKALKAQLAMAEEESRRARPMRDALVRELQVRTSTGDAARALPAASAPALSCCRPHGRAIPAVPLRRTAFASAAAR